MTKSELFKQAWAEAKVGANKFGGSVKLYFAEALKNAYKTIKAIGIKIVSTKKATIADNMVKIAETWAVNEITCSGHKKVVANDWQKNGKNRTYISIKVYTNAWNIKREYKCGYVDNNTDEYIVTKYDSMDLKNMKML